MLVDVSAGHDAATAREHVVASADHVTVSMPIGTDFTTGVDHLDQLAPALLEPAWSAHRRPGQRRATRDHPNALSAARSTADCHRGATGIAGNFERTASHKPNEDRGCV